MIRRSASRMPNASVCKDMTLPELIISAVIFLTVIENVMAIKCFKCAVTVEKSIVRNITVYTPLCSKFDESDEYITDCPFSTMCLKTISSLHLQNGQILETATRGCALQKDTTQVFRDRQWQKEHIVQEVYKEECIEFKENNLAASGKTHCYCRGDLCNAAPRNSLWMSQYFVVIITILVSTAFTRTIQYAFR